MTDRLPLSMIVAVARNGAIGKDGGLPWRYPEDLKYFRAMTRGHAVIMGRKTWNEVGRPLPDRTNIVVTREPGVRIESALVASSVEDAIQLARAVDDSPFIIGGSQIYALAMPFVTDAYITEIGQDFPADTFFTFDRTGFSEVSRTLGLDPALTFVHLRRS